MSMSSIYAYEQESLYISIYTTIYAYVQGLLYISICTSIYAYVLNVHTYVNIYTRRSGYYAPILLAPAEGWGPLGALRALLGAFGPQ